MTIKAKTWNDEQVRDAIAAGKNVVILDSGSHGDDDLFLYLADESGDVSCEEAYGLMAYHLEVEELSDDYHFWDATDGELRAILWDMDAIEDEDAIDAIMARRSAALAAK